MVRRDLELESNAAILMSYVGLSTPTDETREIP